jgi:hypothetical protein
MGKKGGHLTFLHKNRQALAHAGRSDLSHGVFFDQPSFSEKLKIGLQTGKSTNNTPGTLSALHLRNYPGPDMQMPYFA